jgi:hypothetical protein
MNFGVRKFTTKNTPKRKTLMFEHYNLMDPMEWQAEFFEVDVQQGNSNILTVVSSSSHILIFGKNHFFNYVKNYKVW